MQYEINKIRNCQGRYPDSPWAKGGYTLGPLKIYQCPKTYIEEFHVEVIQSFDLFKQCPGTKSILEMPNQFVDTSKLIETERSKVIQQERVDAASKASVGVPRK